jgi:hypothetical protein
LIVEQAARPLQPSGGNGMLAAKCGRVPGQPYGYASGSRSIVLFVIPAVGTFARIEHDVDKIEPPRREPESFERLARLFHGKRRLERTPRAFPIGARKCGSACLDVSKCRS